MTDQELIKALRVCYTGGDCKDCLYEPDSVDCKNVNAAYATDRLEALLADNAALGREIDRQICKRSELEREIGRLEVQVEHLNAGKDTNVPTKWVSAEERLPENADHSVLVVVSGHYENMDKHCAIGFHNAIEIATYFRDDGKWFIEAYPEWENPNVTYWCELPEPPSTEGVE